MNSLMSVSSVTVYSLSCLNSCLNQDSRLNSSVFTLSRMLSRIRIIMIQFDSFANASESLPVANEPIFAHEQPSVRC